MTSNVYTRESTMSDVRELAETMREKDKLEVSRLGLTPYQSLYRSYRYSFLRYTIVVNDKVAAMWGVQGTPMGLIGIPYLLTGTESEKVSVSEFIQIYKNAVEIMRSFFPILENYVDASYKGAIRMLKIAGFEVEDTITPSKDGSPFRKFRLVTK